MKKVLIILNPCAGVRRANRYLVDFVDMFTAAGYLPMVLTTTRRGDAEDYAKRFARDVDLIVCAGGDGTFNETVAGIIGSGADVPLGYIPAGSTNDFARSLKLSLDPVDAVRDIIHGAPQPFDAGRLNERYFSYVASFGAFTRVAYDTPQHMKNVLGHLAYLLNGANELPNLSPVRMRIEVLGGESENMVFEDDYLFGAVTNARSIGGALKLKEDDVDMNDGLFELLLVKQLKSVTQLPDLLRAIGTQAYDSELITFVRGSRFHVKADADTDWALDGEYSKGSEEISIVNMHSAINLMMRSE